MVCICQQKTRYMVWDKSLRPRQCREVKPLRNSNIPESRVGNGEIHFRPCEVVWILSAATTSFQLKTSGALKFLIRKSTYQHGSALQAAAQAAPARRTGKSWGPSPWRQWERRKKKRRIRTRRRRQKKWWEETVKRCRTPRSLARSLCCWCRKCRFPPFKATEEQSRAGGRKRKR